MKRGGKTDPFAEPRICFAVGRGRPCYGQIQVHHIIPQQAIRREWRSLMAAKRRGGPKAWSVTKAIADERNQKPVCWGHHQLVEGGSLRVEYEDLPHGFWDFVAEYDLHSLPRHLQGVARTCGGSPAGNPETRELGGAAAA